MKPPFRISESALKNELSKYGYHSIKNIVHKDADILKLEANKLHPVYIGQGDPLYVQVPVPLSVILTAKNKIKKIEEDSSALGNYKSAEKFVETIVQNNQLQGLGDVDNNSTTHKIEIDKEGKKVIKRKGFSAF